MGNCNCDLSSKQQHGSLEESELCMKESSRLVSGRDAVRGNSLSPVHVPKISSDMSPAARKLYDQTLNSSERIRLPSMEVTDGVYEGEWLRGKRDGRGNMKWNDGAQYDGEWKDDRLHGQGRLIHSGGDVYEGTWENDMANGKGVYLHKDGGRYEGMWLNDLQHGQGRFE
jgi:hypothetical protein